MIQTYPDLSLGYGAGVGHIDFGEGQAIIQDGDFEIIREKGLLGIHNQIALHLIVESEINCHLVGIVDTNEIAPSIQRRDISRSQSHPNHGITRQSKGSFVVKGLRWEFLVPQIQIQR